MNKKTIRTTIRLYGDEFDDTGSNVLIAEGLRTSVVVRFGGGSIMPQAEIVIYGLSLDSMHKLMRIRWRDLNSLLNTVHIEAGDYGEQLHHVYSGNITFAYIDTSNAPEIALRISSMTAIYEAYKKAPSVSFPGKKSVVQAIKEIAERMGYVFENTGVPETLMMEDAYLDDTDFNKIRALCRDYQIDLYPDNDTIAICSQGQPRNIKVIPVLSPQTGLIGYPVPTLQGVDVRCLWNPEVRLGGLIRIKDSLMRTTNGDWRAFGVTTHLECELPGGNWFMDIQAAHAEANDAAISRA